MSKVVELFPEFPPCSRRDCERSAAQPPCLDAATGKPLCVKHAIEAQSGACFDCKRPFDGRAYALDFGELKGRALCIDCWITNGYPP